MEAIHHAPRAATQLLPPLTPPHTHTLPPPPPLPLLPHHAPAPAPALAAGQADRPFLGICLGLQLLFDGSEESGGCEGLGLIPGQVSTDVQGV